MKIISITPGKIPKNKVSEGRFLKQQRRCEGEHPPRSAKGGQPTEKIERPGGKTFSTHRCGRRCHQPSGRRRCRQDPEPKDVPQCQSQIVGSSPLPIITILKNIQSELRF